MLKVAFALLGGAEDPEIGQASRHCFDHGEEVFGCDLDVPDHDCARLRVALEDIHDRPQRGRPGH